MLVRAGRDQQVGDRDAVQAPRRELPLSRSRDTERLGVRPKLVKALQLVLDSLEVARGARAVEELEPRDRTEARLAERRIQLGRADERRLVEQEPARGRRRQD